MYEKKKLQVSIVRDASSDSQRCSLCDRDRSIVYCNSCGNSVVDINIRRPCPKHPRAYLLMGIDACNKCKSTDLLEVGLDDIPSHLMGDFKFSEPPSSSVSVSGTSSSVHVRAAALGTSIRTIKEQPEDELMDIVEDSVILSPPLQPAAIRTSARGRGERSLKRARVALPSNFQSKVQAPVTGPFSVGVAASIEQSPGSSTPPTPASGARCVCKREVRYVVCAVCGFFQTGMRKYIPCPVHPQERQGLKFCPECGVDGKDNLDEGTG